jgi:hypothetical protein
MLRGPPGFSITHRRVFWRTAGDAHDTAAILR